MAKALLIGKTIVWSLVAVVIGLLALGLWKSPSLPSANLKPEAIRAFEASANTGRLHCFAPQHYSLAEVERTDPQAGKDLRALVPQDIIDARNADDIYSIVSVIDGKGVYVRYFGYQSLAETALCW